jgi:hypothetical protein
VLVVEVVGVVVVGATVVGAAVVEVVVEVVEVVELVTPPAGPHPFHAGPHSSVNGCAVATPARASHASAAARI